MSSSSVDKAKKLKYLGVQFITIDDPLLEQSRLSLNSQRNNSCARMSVNNSKQNIDALQPYPGLENSNELFTRDEISEINYSLNLGSDSNNKYRFKPTSRLSLLKQASQTIREKSDYEKNLEKEENDEKNLLEKSNQQNTVSFNQTNPPSTPLTRCDSLISCQGEDETDFLPGSGRRSRLNTASAQGYNNILNEDGKDNQNLSLTQGEMQNQIWLYAHNAKIPRSLDELDEPSGRKNISARSLPNKNINENSKKNDSTNKTNNKNVNNKKINDNANNSNNDNSKKNDSTNKANKNANNNKGNESNNNRLLNKNLNNQNQRSIQTRKSASQQINFSYLDENHIQTINGSIVDGKTQLNLNRGEKRLKRIIAMSAPKETITPEFKTKSILKNSYCAQRVHQYLLESSIPIPIPTFLREASDENSD